jgi:hypothetical protein
MPSRSAITKLKVILVIDVLIVAAAAGVYFYLQAQGLIVGPLKQAEFIVTDLTINPVVAEVFEPVLVTVNVTNIGDEQGEYVANLTINNILEENQTILIPGRNSTIVEFTVLKETEGNYTVEIGGLSGFLTTKIPPPTASKIGLSTLFVKPYEAWPNETITATVTATNIGEELDSLSVRCMVDNSLVELKKIELAAKETTTVEFTFNATTEGKHTIQVNSLAGTFTVVPAGYHTLTVARSGGGSRPLTFTLNGVTHDTPYTELLPVGQYSIDAPNIVNVGTGVLEFSYWSDGSKSTSITFTLDKRLIITATYTVISGYASCPSLFFWNGTHYVYVTEVSNAGWLGYMDYINANGDIVFSGGNPWDYVKLDKNQLQLRADTSYNANSDLTLGMGSFFSAQLPFVILIVAGIVLALLTLDAILIKTGKSREKKLMLDTLILALLLISQLVAVLPFASGMLPSQVTTAQNDYYDIILFQQWDELFYLDAAYMMVVDHPTNVDVYSTMSNYINQAFNGQIYTVSKDNLITPVSAVNEKGENVLPQISQLDGVFTPGSNGLASPSWDKPTLNQLTLDLGDLSSAPQIKLIINGMVDWGAPEHYYTWVDGFKTAFNEGLVPNGTQIYPAPYMEIKDASGQWVRIPQDRQMPTPSDYVPRSFAVDLTGLFPTDVSKYQIRLTNFFNVTFDYIGIDTTPQENIKVQRINPAATLHQIFASPSSATGNFTKYGDVTQLVTEEDDMFVIGRQGDQVSLRFPTASLAPLEDGMERDYFMFVACWFKDPPGNWGYGFNFTVDPLPFRNMSGFPYPDTESYPCGEAYLQYLRECNTRVIKAPSQSLTLESSLTTWATVVIMIIGVVDLGVLVYFKKRNR